MIAVRLEGHSENVACIVALRCSTRLGVNEGGCESGRWDSTLRLDRLNSLLSDSSPGIHTNGGHA